MTVHYILRVDVDPSVVVDHCAGAARRAPGPVGRRRDPEALRFVPELPPSAPAGIEPVPSPGLQFISTPS